MSQPVNQTAACPGCGKELELTLWQSIDTNTENAREDVISGRLFDVCCPHCGYKARLDYPTLFNDLEHNIWVWYFPEERAEEAMPTIEAARREGTKCRLVFTQEDLSEKAAIFKLDLDDRIIEIMKVAARAQICEALPGFGIGPVVFALREGEPCFVFMADGKPDFLDLNLEEYEFFKTTFSPMLDADEDSVVIDYQWASGFIGFGAQAEEE